MADTFGALLLPSPPLVVGGPIALVAGDPFLTYLLPYLQATITAYLLPLWQSAGIAPTRPIVGYTFPFDPGAHGFVDQKTPALYAWREGEPMSEWLAADWTLDQSNVTLLYVFEPHANPEVVKARQPMVNAIRKAVIEAIEANRHPSWVVPGDTDPNAATTGSDFAGWAGFHEVQVMKGKAGKLRVRYDKETSDYDTYEITLAVKERQTIDISPLPNLQGLATTYETADTTPLVIGTESDT